MSFTFSSTQEVNYLAIGACDICAVRLTHGCEHSDNQDYQEWLAAQVVAESGKVNEEAFITLIAFAEACDAHPADVAYDLEATTEAEQVAAEVASDNQWLDSDTSRIALPQVNASGNLQWQGVEFDMQAITEYTKTRSAALKSEIDKRMERAEQDWKQRNASVKLHSPKVIV